MEAVFAASGRQDVGLGGAYRKAAEPENASNRIHFGSLMFAPNLVSRA
jgi:hypothetical protein